MAMECHHGRLTSHLDVPDILKELRVLDLVGFDLAKQVSAIGVFRLSDHAEGLAFVLTSRHFLSIPCFDILDQNIAWSQSRITRCRRCRTGRSSGVRSVELLS